MTRQWRNLGWVAGLTALAISCSGPNVQYADGRIAATVLGTRPIVGAEVRIWEVFQGERSADPVATAVTDGAGRFDVHIGVAFGQILIETSGGTTEELISGEAVTLGADVRLAAVIPDFKPDEQREGLVVSPLTTMAEALGEARLARGDKEADYETAHARALDLIGAHFGDVDLMLVEPADPTETVAGTLTASARYGLVLAALSRVAVTIASESRTTANVVNNVVLTGALAADLASEEALFDGMNASGDIVVGMCPEPDVCSDEACTTICDIGASTVRAVLANELERFVESTQNVTGLGLPDITEMKLAIAKNTEPELFGDAPIDNEGALLTLSDEGFYVDPATDVWWTFTRSPDMLGTVTIEGNETVTISIEVDGLAVATAEILADDIWFASLPANALAAPPSASTVRVVATDSVGNRTVIEKAMRVDALPPSVVFDARTVVDERQDTIDFGSAPPVQGHPGPSVTLDGGGCPDIYKHVHLMTDDPNDNPIKLTFSVTDDGSGINPAWTEYQVRKGGTAHFGWAPPDASRIITAGAQYDIYLTRAKIAALGTDDGTFEVIIRGVNNIGESSQATQCFVNHPLGPPLRSSNVRNGATSNADGDTQIIHDAKLTRHNLPVSNLAPLINGTVAGAGAGVMLFDVENPWDEPVYFQVGWNQPTASRTKTWKRSAIVSSTTTVNLNCLTTPSNCNASWPYSEEIVSVGPGPVSNLIGGTRVWDMAGGVPAPVNPCAGCNANRYLIPARTGETPRKFRVMLVTTDLSALHPGETDTGNYAEYLISGLTLTGLNLTQTFSRCTDRDVDVDINGNITSDRCIQRTTYRRYLALTNAAMTIQPITGSLQTSPTATGSASGLPTTNENPAPVLENQWTWTTAETSTPPKPAGMP